MAISHVTRAVRAGVAVDVVDVGRLYHDQRGVCGICRRPVGFSVFTVDHKRPLSKGGVHAAWNLQITHRACNSKKGAALPPGYLENIPPNLKAI
jgi:5-methylcytosine-specific restriction endonuclease McrA